VTTVLSKASLYRSAILFILILTSLTYAEKNANIAMLMCLVPGGGQFYTERYIPGLVIGATEIALGYYAYKYHQDGEYSQRNSILWWGLFIFGFSLADAYVGAKMHGFDVEADIDRVSFSYNMRW
jgi:hypothetical protein